VYEHDGRKFYFCAASCKEKFKADPAKYLNKPASKLVTLGMPENQPKAAVASSAYVCPMCPDVRESKPGACPSCGMALEPEFPHAARTEYTCPMHPQIVRDQPGSCPICGMTLELR